MSDSSVREPAAAGTFYSADAAFLADQIVGFTEKSGVNSAGSDVAAVLVPHAGYPYSGYTAACAYARVRECPTKRVVLIGVSHHFRFAGISLPRAHTFTTPLGPLPIDAELKSEIGKMLQTTDTDAHGPEHAIEVQLPFLQVIFGEVSILPVLFGDSDPSAAYDLANALNEQLDKNDLVVATSDLSHYLIEHQANAIDKRTLDSLMNRDPMYLRDELEAGHCSMCSAPAVMASMHYANLRDAVEWQMLDYRTSAEASGDTSRVVGYAAVSMEIPACV